MEDLSFSQASEEVIELATTFVEKYVDYVENLPFDMQRSVTRLREIDCSCREVITEIEALYASFTKEKDINLKRRATLVQIQRLFGRCQELGDEKISIIQQISESIENRKKQVEHTSYRFRSLYRPDQKNDFNGKRELHKSDCQKGSKRSRRNRHNYIDKQNEKEKAIHMDTIPATTISGGSSTNNGNGGSLNGKQGLHLSLENTYMPADLATSKVKDDYPSSRKTDKSEKKEVSPTSSSSSISTAMSSGSAVPSSVKTTSSSKVSTTKASSNNKTGLITPTSNGANKSTNKGKKKKKKVVKHHIERTSTRSPSPQVDIPIDPEEPTYCLCDQVSFGQMIGCDNKKCPIEWFHFSCVGLTHKPKGKWYCPDCMRDRKKETRRDHR